MAKLFYGSGYCSVEGAIQGIEIRYKGSIEITKTCNEDCLFQAKSNGIMVVSLSGGILGNLFKYSGELNIISVIAADNNGQKVPCPIKKVMDYSELLDTKSEDLTVKSEDLKAGNRHKARPKKTIVLDNIIKNQHTKTHNGDLYLEDGSLYDGCFHVHPGGRVMTGNTHTRDSRQLNIKRTTVPMYRKGRRR